MVRNIHDNALPVRIKGVISVFGLLRAKIAALDLFAKRSHDEFWTVPMLVKPVNLNWHNGSLRLLTPSIVLFFESFISVFDIILVARHGTHLRTFG